MNKIDDYFYDVVRTEKEIDLSNKDMRKLIEQTMELAQNNYEILQ